MRSLLSNDEDASILRSFLEHPAITEGAMAGFSVEVLPPESILDSCKVLYYGGAIFIYEPIPPFDSETLEYQVHSLVIPEFRGASALGAAIDSLAWVFTVGMARKVYTLCQHNRKDAIAFAKWAGLKHQIETRQWKMLSIDFVDWVNENESLAAIGKIVAQLDELPLPDDPRSIQAKWVGYLRKMAASGYPALALRRYDTYHFMLGLFPIDDVRTSGDDLRVVLNGAELVLANLQEEVASCPQ